ncbi:prenylcysteine oxidase 1-like [Anneissia japonica]|uniref:prenylcysteine oxidase 1-like n=1 Tax=Anneissia japonica TaxID=1529436 RepID=UPI001425852B|nr:prenylcysteine oxidase 1-like [Anneissia japonica]
MHFSSFFILTLVVSFLESWPAYAVTDQNNKNNDEAVEIAVIGGGIGGTSCSHFLRELFGDAATISLFEPKAIGGRMATVEMAGRQYESGGSVLHEKNMYMNKFVEDYGLDVADSPSLNMGIYDGEEFVFEESSFDIVNLLKLMWRYKLDFFYLNNRIDKMIEKFNSIYEIQDAGYAFSTPAKLLNAMDMTFMNYTKEPLARVLKDDFGLSQRTIDELASVATRDNYGQSVNMTAFAGLISLAGVQPGLWSVFGGNKLVCEKLLNSSKATWVNEAVVKVEGAENGSYTLYWEDETSDGELKSKTFDIVIVATPLHDKVSNISFEGISPDIHNFHGEYQRTVATFIRGTPNSTYFGKSTGGLPDQVLTTQDGNIPIRTLALKIPVDFASGSNEDIPNVYKMFSERPLSGNEIDVLFLNRSEVKVIDWRAYPNYSTNQKLPPYQLNEKLYYTSGLEWGASAMEVGAISAKNVALLAFQNWKNNSKMIDSYDNTTSRDEL